MTIQANNSFGNNLPYPKYICPTNIPLLKNSSLSSYFDIMYEIYTLDIKNSQDYYKSVFQENMIRIRKTKEQNKLKALHQYDLQSRKNIIHHKPVFGNDLSRLIKMNLFPFNLSSKQHLYGKSHNHELFYNNLNNSIIFNKFFKKTNFEECEKKDRINNKIYEAIYKDRELQNELDRLIKLVQRKEREIEEDKEKSFKFVNSSNLINHQSQIKKIGVGLNNQEYKNNLIINQNKKINSSININNLNLNLNKNKHLKLNNINSENPIKQDKDDICKTDKDDICKTDKDFINIKNLNGCSLKEENIKYKNAESESGLKEQSTINEIEMTNRENGSEEFISNKDNLNEDSEEIIDLEKDDNNDINENNEIDVEIYNENIKDILIENTFTEKNNVIEVEINKEISNNCENENMDKNKLNKNGYHINGDAHIDLNIEKLNNSLIYDLIKPSNKNSNLDIKNKPVVNEIKNEINSNYIIKTANVVNIKNLYQGQNTQLHNYKPDPEKLKEIEELKKKIDFLKKLLKTKQIDKIKENFIEMKIDKKSCFDSIRHVNTDTIHDMIFNPQKMISICDELMTRYKFFIPKFVSNGPQLVPSIISSENQQLNNRYRMLYNNLNRVPNVQKYLALFKIISLPDKKLVEYDSGKLMKLARLLKNLKQNKSKALIFTQVLLNFI